MSNKKIYIWCTYRNWSFKILDAIQDIDGWKAGLIITTDNCIYDFERFKNIPILKINPKESKKEFQKGGRAYEAIMQINPDTIITPGWSWYIPKEIYEFCPCVTYHPGMLPYDRGCSPIQHQIRNGEAWTYVNVIKQEEGFDEGPVYMIGFLDLSGYADDVWNRMTSIGILLTIEYLRGMDIGGLRARPQKELHVLDSYKKQKIFKRIKPIDAELEPSEQSANQMFNIIRAHYETDPNSYVVPAYINIGDNKKLEIYRASLNNELDKEMFSIHPHKNYGIEIHQIAYEVNNGNFKLTLTDKNNNKLYINQVNVMCKETKHHDLFETLSENLKHEN